MEESKTAESVTSETDLPDCKGWKTERRGSSLNRTGTIYIPLDLREEASRDITYLRHTLGDDITSIVRLQRLERAGEQGICAKRRLDGNNDIANQVCDSRRYINQ